MTKVEMLEGVEGVKFSVLINNNTVRYKKQGSDNVYVRLYRTDIIVQDNRGIVLNSGGYKTLTTKNRINEHQELCFVRQEKGIWIVGIPPGKGRRKEREYIYYDGIRILNSGRIKKGGSK